MRAESIVFEWLTTAIFDDVGKPNVALKPHTLPVGMTVNEFVNAFYKLLSQIAPNLNLKLHVNQSRMTAYISYDKRLPNFNELNREAFIEIASLMTVCNTLVREGYRNYRLGQSLKIRLIYPTELFATEEAGELETIAKRRINLITTGLHYFVDGVFINKNSKNPLEWYIDIHNSNSIGYLRDILKLIAVYDSTLKPVLLDSNNASQIDRYVFIHLLKMQVNARSLVIPAIADAHVDVIKRLLPADLKSGAMGSPAYKAGGDIEVIAKLNSTVISTHLLSGNKDDVIEVNLVTIPVTDHRFGLPMGATFTSNRLEISDENVTKLHAKYGIDSQTLTSDKPASVASVMDAKNLKTNSEHYDLIVKAVAFQDKLQSYLNNRDTSGIFYKLGIKNTKLTLARRAIAEKLFKHIDTLIFTANDEVMLQQGLMTLLADSKQLNQLAFITNTQDRWLRDGKGELNELLTGMQVSIAGEQPLLEESHQQSLIQNTRKK